MVRETKLYDTLGVKPTSTTNEITKAYRKLAKHLHPDKPTGDGVKFRKIQSAHEILIDDEKRKVYDNHGQKGLDDGPRMQQSGFTGFPGFPGQRRRAPTKAPPVTFELTTTLKQMYTGCTRKLNVKYKKLCTPCNGHGGSGNKSGCPDCRGVGVRVPNAGTWPGYDATGTSFMHPLSKGPDPFSPTRPVVQVVLA